MARFWQFSRTNYINIPANFDLWSNYLVHNVLRTFFCGLRKISVQRANYLVRSARSAICTVLLPDLACGLLWRRYYKPRGGAFSHVRTTLIHHNEKNDHILTRSIFLAYHTMIHVKWTEIWDRFFLLYFACLIRRTVYLKLTGKCCMIS